MRVSTKNKPSKFEIKPHSEPEEIVPDNLRDILFGNDPRVTSLREGSLYRHLIEAHWEQYCELNCSPKGGTMAKHDFVQSMIMDYAQNIVDGRFLLYVKESDGRKYWKKLDPEDPGDARQIEAKIQQAFRDEKKKIMAKETATASAKVVIAHKARQPGKTLTLKKGKAPRKKAPRKAPRSLPIRAAVSTALAPAAVANEVPAVLPPLMFTFGEDDGLPHIDEFTCLGGGYQPELCEVWSSNHDQFIQDHQEEQTLEWNQNMMEQLRTTKELFGSMDDYYESYHQYEDAMVI